MEIRPLEDRDRHELEDFLRRDQMSRALTAAQLDVYEAAVRAVTELEWLLARTAPYEPISSLTRRWADLTRDGTAVQLSTARWMLDL